MASARLRSIPEFRYWRSFAPPSAAEFDTTAMRYIELVATRSIASKRFCGLGARSFELIALPADEEGQSRGIVGINHDPSSKQLGLWSGRATCSCTLFGRKAQTTIYVHTAHYGHRHCQTRPMLLITKLSASNCGSRVTCLPALTIGAEISPTFPPDRRLSADLSRLV